MNEIMYNYRIRFLIVVMLLFTACQGTNSAAKLAHQITLYDWDNDLPQQALTSFEQEFKVNVKYITYESQEEALENIHKGLDVDLIVFDSRFVPGLINEGLLAPLSYENIPNFRYISPSFRDLVYDSGNRYSIPYSWGTIGLVVRSDLVEEPIQSWADLWNPLNKGKIAFWRNEERLVIGLTLKSLGFSVNTNNQTDLEAASEKLMEIRPGIAFYEDYDENNITAAFLSGDIVAGMGFAGDYLEARQDINTLEYVFPTDGALLWGDVFVVPSSSKEKYTAEVFLNYLLRPEVSASIVNFNHYATANLNAFGKISQEILKEPAIFPPLEKLRKAESILPVSDEAQRIYDEIWNNFLPGVDQK